MLLLTNFTFANIQKFYNVEKFLNIFNSLIFTEAYKAN